MEGAGGHGSHKCLALLLGCSGAGCNSLLGHHSAQADGEGLSCFLTVASWGPLPQFGLPRWRIGAKPAPLLWGQPDLGLAVAQPHFFARVRALCVPRGTSHRVEFRWGVREMSLINKTSGTNRKKPTPKTPTKTTNKPEPGVRLKSVRV